MQEEEQEQEQEQEKLTTGADEEEEEEEEEHEEEEEEEEQAQELELEEREQEQEEEQQKLTTGAHFPGGFSTFGASSSFCNRCLQHVFTVTAISCPSAAGSLPHTKEMTLSNLPTRHLFVCAGCCHTGFKR